MKILITGNAGSGKSTTAAALADELGMSWSSLDRVVWKSGWKKTSKAEKDLLIEALISQSSWIVDGVSHKVFDAADTIIFLDLPLHACLINIFCRFLKNRRFCVRSTRRIQSEFCISAGTVNSTLNRLQKRYQYKARLEIRQEAIERNEKTITPLFGQAYG